MKILITILLALFISGQAYSEYRYKDLKDVCGNYEDRIVLLNNVITKEADNKIKKEGEEILQYYAKLYHYLDCSDFR